MDVPDFEDCYEISSHGRLRSKTRLRANSATGTRLIPSQIIAPYVRKDGYYTVRLANNRQKISTYIHKLVAIAFHGHPPPGQEVLHKNGNKADNTVDNLHWGTRGENISDRKRHGGASIGVKHGMAKLTEAQVLSIRSDVRSSYTDIAKEYSISRSTVRLIKQRVLWKHLP